MPEALANAIDIIENIANGDQENGAGAYWEDAEMFIRDAEWEMLQDLELPPPPPFHNEQPW